MAPWYMTLEDQEREAAAQKRLTDFRRGLTGKMLTPQDVEQLGRLEEEVERQLNWTTGP